MRPASLFPLRGAYVNMIWIAILNSYDLGLLVGLCFLSFYFRDVLFAIACIVTSVPLVLHMSSLFFGGGCSDYSVVV